jgi:hypothetical protein
MLLLTSKLAADQMDRVSLICESGAEESCRRFMYGKKYAEGGVDEDGCARPISQGNDMEAALKKATSLILTAYDKPLDEKTVNTLFDTTGEDLSKVVLLSKMGVKKSKGGFLGGGGNSNLLSTETYLRDVCKSKDIDFSIIRAGTLKGGGPGQSGNNFGLNEVYYNTLVDSVEASVTMAHDKYTLGADCSIGDNVEMPNMFTSMGTKSSFDAYPYDSNRIVVAGGTVAAALKEGPIEISIGSAKAEKPPTQEEWSSILEEL